MAAEQDRRQAWLEAYADTLAYREELADSVSQRRQDLGVAAAITQPDHVVELIGAVPSDNPASLQRWTNMAGRIEAYREEWGVVPQRLRERPLDAYQARDWEVALHKSEMLARPRTPALDRGLDHWSGQPSAIHAVAWGPWSSSLEPPNMAPHMAFEAARRRRGSTLGTKPVSVAAAAATEPMNMSWLASDKEGLEDVARSVPTRDQDSSSAGAG